jgi:hypothetical protein
MRPKPFHFVVAVAALVTASLQAGLAAGDRPLVFAPNAGQNSKPVLFTSQGPGYSLHFTAGEAIFHLGKQPDAAGTLRLRVLDSLPDVAVSGVGELPARVNYLIGNDPDKWHTGIVTYGQVAYKNVLDGIDLLYYGHDGRLEYDFRLAPGANPGRIQMALEGRQWKAHVTPAGDLEIRGAAGAIRFARPVAYQLRADGSRQPVKSAYALEDDRHFGFHVGRYDRSRELVIDPAFVYSEYYGGSGNDSGIGIAIDGQGNTYIAGSTGSTDLPGVSSGYQTTNKGIGVGGNAFVAKFNAGGQLVAATYLGGSNFTQGLGVAADSSGNALVVGQTQATDFPLQNAVQTTCAPTGAVDRFTCAYSTFSSCAAPGSQANAFITKLDSTLSHLIYSTYFGGSANTNATSVAVNAAGEAFVTGSTMSKSVVHTGCALAAPACGNDPPDAFGVPTTSNAYMQAPLVSSCSLTGPPFWNGNPPFVSTWFARFSTAGALLYSSYFVPAQSNGGQQTAPSGIALDSAGGVYLAGATNDTGFTAIPGNTSECNNCNNGHWNGWAAKFNLNASGNSQLIYSNLFGGSADDTASGIAVDQQGNAYVGGNTNGSDFPTTAGSYQPTRPADGSKQGFVAKLNEQGTAFAYASNLRYGLQSTTLGGIGVDNSEAATVIGDYCGPGCGLPGTIVFRWTPDGSSLSYSTDVVTFGIQDGAAIVVDNANNAYITGTTGTFPTTIGGSCANLNNCGDGNTDAFVAEINMGVGPANPIAATTTGASNVTATYSPASESITLTAGVTGGSGVNVGSVMFTLLGTNVSGNVSGGMASASFTVPANTHPGNYPIQAVYVPGGSFAISSDTTHMLTIQKATPTITWSNPAGIVFGTALDGTQLNASTVVAGSFVYSPPSTTVLPAGNGQMLSTTFTPTDTTDYNVAMASVHINVAKANPVITWANPADIVHGTALSATQMNATANVPGSFVYNPPAGTVLPGGAGQTLSTTFTPTDTTDYNVVTASVQINVNIVKTTPVVTWAKPADILFGSALGPTQLNASANVPGTFVYTPPAGTVLQVGNNQTLSVMFTPTDTVDFNTASGSTSINVNPPMAACGASGGSSPQLTVTWTLTRVDNATAAPGLYANLTIANTGNASATNVQVTVAKIGSISAFNLPISLSNPIGCGSSGQTTVLVPDQQLPSGTNTTMTIGGTYTGGSFSSTRRIVVP